jgi:transcriptional regulator with XRE-family HTH domain
METLGDILRKGREGHGLLLREVAAKISIDPALLSKIERGERRATREQLERLSDCLRLEKDRLIATWHSERISYELYRERNASEILHLAEAKVEYLRKSLNNQNNG